MKTSFLTIMVCSVLSSAILQAGETERRISFENYRKYYALSYDTAPVEKIRSLAAFREYFAIHPFSLTSGINDRKYSDYLPLLQKDGKFSDLKDEDAGKADIGGNEANSAGCIIEALDRLWTIAEEFRSGKMSVETDADVFDRCLKSILHYGELEICRPNDWRRFHSSCFAIPVAATNIYFCFFAQMNAVEEGLSENRLLSDACTMLKMLGLQAWTQPFRDDFTDADVLDPERFRKSAWWVGGNALGYRPLLQSAFMLRNVPMVDLIVELCQKAFLPASQNTYDTAFWNEGFTADGAGWGHGRQCLVWRYPIDGVIGALDIMGILKDSPWNPKLSRESVAGILNYLRGSSWYYYKGYVPPCLDRTSMLYREDAGNIGYTKMLGRLIEDWSDSFTADELAELKSLYADALENDIAMPDYDSLYNGSRWFFNSDDLIKKNDRYHIMVNMSSSRCDGIESAPGFADGYNFFTTDGSTFFQKSGDEYRDVLGAFDVTAFPGVTAREGMEHLKPVTNWRGYTSMHNFAAGATLGGENAVGGYIFEKIDGSDAETVNDKDNAQVENALIYGVRAYKSWFMLGDYMVCLGAGVSNLTPEIEGNVRTTLDQTGSSGDVREYKGRKGVKWVVNGDKFAYSAFPEYADRTHYVVETRKTDWVKRNKANRNKQNLPQDVEVFQMWIDHDREFTDDTYGYVVYAGEGLPSRTYPFEVLRNDTSVQAVCSQDGEVVEAVFYDSSAAIESEGLHLSVSAPCAVLGCTDGF